MTHGAAIMLLANLGAIGAIVTYFCTHEPAWWVPSVFFASIAWVEACWGQDGEED
jgi:hypothetical protein